MNAEVSSVSGDRQFGPVRIAWSFQADGLDCYVWVYWNDQLIVGETLGPKRLELDFAIRTETDFTQRVSGTLSFDVESNMLRIARLRYPGATAEINDDLGSYRPLPPSPPSPPSPPAPVDDIQEDVISEVAELFPFLYLRNWPQITPQALEDRFVRYTPTSPPISDFYAQLTNDRKDVDARSKMVDASLLFVRGALPYEGQFAQRPQALGAEFVAIEQFVLSAKQLAYPRALALIELIAELWGLPWSDITDAMGTAEFEQQVERAWETVFALNCVLGYDRGTLAAMTQVLVGVFLLKRLAATNPATLDQDWPASRLKEGLRATLILPADVFPLPPAEVTEDAKQVIEILPYAIGDLHVVKRQLLSYALGEVSHIESVMADEKKVRARQESSDSELIQTSERHVLSSEDALRAGLSESFEAQIQNQLREQFQADYTTTYGPPQEAKQVGSYTLKPLDNEPKENRTSDQSGLARRITQEAARRAATHLTEQRMARYSRSSKSEVSQCFDRRGRNTNQRGIYRWLDARYRCWVAPLGRRLMLQFFVTHPAKRLIESQQELSGIALGEPISPSQLGLGRFDDISLDPTSPLYYASLAARYGVDDVEPPPADQVNVSSVFELGSPLYAQIIALPDGYAATSATISLTTAAQDVTVSGRVGSALFSISGKDGAGVQGNIALADQTSSLPFSLALEITATEGEQTSPSVAYAVNIEVVASRTERWLERWQSVLYTRLIQGYRQLQSNHLEATGATRPTVNPLYAQRIIRSELKRAGVSSFLRIADRLTGEVEAEHHFAPALCLWLDQALEWSEMTYTLINHPSSALPAFKGGHMGDPGPLAEFVQADTARVLLPVSPSYEHSLLYFLATGMVWSGEDLLAPTFETAVDGSTAMASSETRYVDLVDDLKSASFRGPTTEPRDSWTLTLPTTMTVLQDDDRLPVFAVPL
ncbi:hypothetical protein [Xanthomonas sp. Leaf148]|uniref:hypothetical protein n=1 Tax=Xanthomonas sp. Leaf148 TaxID=1736275 RepID=UPI000701109A|nr:hypothetical protein [Xanthomonas sp. Leaf148]KQR18046.1 hypothetical protein ASF90_00690 [Xanthomonas sp. Leaf148]